MELSQEGMGTGAGVQTFCAHSADTAALGIVLYQHSVPETLKSGEEAGDGK